MQEWMAHHFAPQEIGQALLTLGLTAFLAGLIGMERQFKGRPAGLRTHVLVAVGAALMMMIGSQFGSDAARIAAGVITGIGFLGAGTIINSERGPTGLTTAATVWFSATLGTAIGLQQYALGAVATVLVLAIVRLLAIAESYIPSRHHLRIQVVVDHDEGGHDALKAALEDELFEVVDIIRLAASEEGENMEALLHVSTRRSRPTLHLQIFLEEHPIFKRPYTIELM